MEIPFFGKKTKAVATVQKKQDITEIFAERYNIESGSVMEILAATAFKPKGSARFPTVQEMTALLVIANQYGLNPFTKEIYAFEKNGAIEAIVPIDGWMTICNRHPQFNGMKFVDEKDSNGELVSITCQIFRKDRELAIEVTEYLAECKKDTGPWKKWPARMLRHKAAIQCARYAFGLSGIYDPDEADRIMESADSPAPKQDPEPKGPGPYPDDKFKSNFPTWEAMIQSGTKTAANVIATIQSNYTLSAEQLEKINEADIIDGEIIEANQEDTNNATS